MAEDIPIKIPGYRIEKLLGEGGMARVFLAVQEGFDRPVALKVISPQLAVDAEFGRRFLREARIVGNLTHTNIVPVYDVGEQDGLYYLSMEILPGGDLKSRLQRAISQNEALEITAQIASALAYAHDKGFIHRDVKPDNVLFRDDGTAVLTDFGIARTENDSADITQITQVRAVIGSPKYMSPEQATGEKLDLRTDIYSLGIMLYEMLAGSVPYDGKNITEISLQRAERRSPQLPAQFGPLQQLTNKMLAYDRQSRYQNCRDLIADIKRTQQGLELANTTESTVVYTPPDTAAKPSSSSAKIATSLVAVAILIAAGVWYLLDRPALPDPQEQTNNAEQAVAEVQQSKSSAGQNNPAVIKPAEYFAFTEAINSTNQAPANRFLREYPNSILGGIIRIKVLGDTSLLESLGAQAEQNDVASQVVLSELYDTGWGVDKNLQLAKQWAAKAAESGQPFPLYQYAMLLIGNEPTDSEMRTALAALENSSRQGFFLAQTILGNQYFAGTVRDRNIEEAIRLFELAGAQGDRNALFNLGQIYDGGIGIDSPDLDKGKGYFLRAAQLGHPDAQQYLN